MKAIIINKEKIYQPIKIELTIDTIEEFNSLWHRLNVSPLDVKESYKDKYNITNDKLTTEYLMRFFNVINNIKRERVY